MSRQDSPNVVFDDPELVAQVKDALAELRALDAQMEAQEQEKEQGGSHGQQRA